MDKEYLQDLIEKRKNLIEQYPSYIGRHAYFKEQIPYLTEVLTITDKERLRELGHHFIKARANETASHFQRINTQQGCELHKLEEEVYSLALDVALTYANK